MDALFTLPHSCWLRCEALLFFSKGRAFLSGNESRPSNNNAFPWAKLISEHAKGGRGREALRLYKRMREEEVTPNSHAFVAALKACSTIADLEAGKIIHSHAVESGHHMDAFVGCSLVHMYAKCGSIPEARQVFERMTSRNVVSWNAMITAYAQKEMGTLALDMFERMQMEGFAPDAHTFTAALKACGSLAAQEADKRMKTRYLEQGRIIHLDVARRGLESDIFIATTLIDMYAKCGSIEDARRIFDKMRHRNVVSWNAIIIAYAQMEIGDKTLELYDRMCNEGFTPDARTFVAVLKACGILAMQERKGVETELRKKDYLEQGRHIHAEVAKRGLVSELYVASTLVDMYAKCGSIEDARRVFETMKHRDVVSWTAMITGYAQMEMGEMAFKFYSLMQQEGVTPDACTFVAVLKACCNLTTQEEGKGRDGRLMKAKNLAKGRAIHAEVTKRGFQSNTVIANTLVDMYAKCGSISDARQVFETMRHKDVVSWTAMIMGYVQMEMGDSALDLYAQMQQEGFTPNAQTFVAALKACCSLAVQEGNTKVDGKILKKGYLEQGRAIHAEVARREFESDVFVSSTLVDMYAKCGSIEDAQQVFERMSNRNVVTWNAMIIGYTQMEMADEALELYERMQKDGFTPDNCTYIAALKACGILAVQEVKGVESKLVKRSCLEQGRAIHADVAKRGFESDIYVGSTLADMYTKCGSIEAARQVFEALRYRDVVSWNAMISGYAQMDMGDTALGLYARMQHEGFTPDARTFVATLKACSNLAMQEDGKVVYSKRRKKSCLDQGRAIHAEVAKRGLESDLFIANTMVDMYAKCGSIEDARKVFEKMRCRDVVSWNAMIIGYAQLEMGGLALQLYKRMQQEGFTLDARTFVAVLKACGSLASLETGKEIHAQIQVMGLQTELFIANCLVDMYAKCGSMVDAQQFFDSLLVRDSVTWNTLIAGYSGQGDSKRSFHLYKRMQLEGIKPDSVTFISVLTVCSHNGLVDEGRMYFKDMCLEYGISPSNHHYTCMVDLLGRVGKLDEALVMLKKTSFEPDMVTLMTILGACRKWNNVEIARSVFECSVNLDEKFAVAYVLMMNIYVSAQLWEESVVIQKLRTKARAWKKPGQCRWTDGNGIVHTFIMGDGNHPQSNEIYARVTDIEVKMKEEYITDLNNAPLNIFDNEMEDALCGHGEKLAIACALINTPPKTPIRIVKTPHVCVGCHSVIAFVSKIEQRTIICRDARRFHVFKDGECSCGNYW